MRHILIKETLGCLTFLGLWPKSTKSTKSISYLVLLSSSFLFFGSLFYLISERKFGSNYIDSIETITGQFGVLYFSTCFTIKREGTLKIVQLLSDFSKYGKPRFFDDRNRQLTKLQNYLLVLLFIANIGVVACPQIYINSCYKFYEQLNITKTCGLVAPVWLPFDYDHNPQKLLVVIWQSYCCLVSYGSGGLISLVLMGTMEHLIIRIEELKDMFPEILMESKKHLREEKLTHWIEFHLHLFDIGKLMNDTYSYCLAVIVFCIGILFGCIGVSTMQVAPRYSSIYLFLGWLLSMGIVCSWGQRLLDSYLSVGIAVYSSKWYEMDVSFQKSVYMILIRSQRPIFIYAGPFTYISHLLILTVFQTAYSYINLLNASS